MTATSRGRVAIVALIVALAFGAAFAVRKCDRRWDVDAGSAHTARAAVDSRARLWRRAARGCPSGAAPPAAPGRSRAELHAGLHSGAGFDPGARHAGALHAGHAAEQWRRWR